MLLRALRKLERFLREHQDPRYRNAPWVLPWAWHGQGRTLTPKDLEGINVRDWGLDPVRLARQPHNQMLLAMTRHAQKPESK